MNRRSNGGPRRSRAMAGYLVSLLALLSPGLAAAQEELATLEPRVQFETTAGNFTIEVNAVRAPLSAENFLRYVRDGFYDGLIIHRVVPGFVIQGGGYDKNFVARPTRAPIPNESGNGLPNLRGTVGMAREDSPHSANSQFYINLQDNPGLNPLPSRWGYAVFGKVVEGMDVVDRIGYVATGESHGFKDAPLEPIVIKRARVVTDGHKAPAQASPAAAPSAGAPGQAPPAAAPPPAGDAAPPPAKEGAPQAGGTGAPAKDAATGTAPAEPPK